MQRLARAWSVQTAAADVGGDGQEGMFGVDIVTMLGFASEGVVRRVVLDNSSSSSSSSISSSISSSSTSDRLVLPSRTIGFMGYIAGASAARSLLAALLPLSQAR